MLRFIPGFVPIFTLLGMYIPIMISNECSLTFASSVIYFSKSINHSMYVDLGFKERIAAIRSMVHFVTWGTEGIH